MREWLSDALMVNYLPVWVVSGDALFVFDLETYVYIDSQAIKHKHEFRHLMFSMRINCKRERHMGVNLINVMARWSLKDGMVCDDAFVLYCVTRFH
jgi:hypothetical protein